MVKKAVGTRAKERTTWVRMVVDPWPELSLSKKSREPSHSELGSQSPWLIQSELKFFYHTIYSGSTLRTTTNECTLGSASGLHQTPIWRTSIITPGRILLIICCQLVQPNIRTLSSFSIARSAQLASWSWAGYHTSVLVQDKTNIATFFEYGVFSVFTKWSLP